MGILQDFYNGEVLPWEHFGGTDDVVYKTFSRKSAKLEESLRVNMDEKEQKVFDELKHIWTTQNNMELERMFLYAFRMGAAFTLDLFAE